MAQVEFLFGAANVACILLRDIRATVVYIYKDTMFLYVCYGGYYEICQCP
jgi:hypothetical protein